MKFSTRGVEEIFSTFIFFAFTLDAFHDINRLFQQDYLSCDSPSKNLVNYLPLNLTDSNATQGTNFYSDVISTDLSIFF